MKFVALSLAIIGCNRDYYVDCEGGFKGRAESVIISKDATYIELPGRGARISYPASIKCNVSLFTGEK